MSSNRAPTERISAFVDLLLKPLVVKSPSYIKDTKHFLRQLLDLPPLPPDALLFTMDVVGLYNNIPHEDGMTACRELLDCRPSKVPPTGDIINLIKLVLTSNAFQYRAHFYLQRHGTAMGTRMAPSYANAFMARLEKTILDTAPDNKRPELYKRFLDDIFGVWLHGEAALLEFIAHANSAHPDITFTYKYGRSVDFLDTVVTLSGSTLVTDLFMKATDTHQYLLPSSNHPLHVHRNLPYSLGVRLLAIVSDRTTLVLRLEELARFLVGRDYHPALIAEQFQRVLLRSRTDVLESSKKESNEDRVPLVCTWSSRLPPLRPLISSAFPLLQANDRLRQIFQQPLISFRRPRNLRDLLVHTRPAIEDLHSRGADAPIGSHPCRSSRCKTCALIHNITKINLGSECHEIRGHFNCATANVIYLITCANPLCCAAYVGETGCPLRQRMTNHRHTIKHRVDTPVAEHFSAQTHTMRVSVIQAASADVLQRRIREKSWIERLRLQGPFNIINRDDGIEVAAL